MSTIQPSLKQQLDRLPTEPGVYQFLDAAGTILYVGKAKNLRNRVRSYFQKGAALEDRKHEMVAKTTGLETIVTNSEADALILEGTLIKRHKPRYNIKLKDSKSYQFIEIDHSQTFPGIEVVRAMNNPKARYFGPFISSWALNRTLKTLNRIFPYKTCSTNLDKYQRTVCLDYHLGKCEGPCENLIDKITYAKRIKHIEQFLRGQHGEILRDLENDMKRAATERNFEYAAKLRDTIHALNITRSKQQVVLHTKEDLDAIAVATGNPPTVNILRIREGYVLSKENIEIQHAEGESVETILGQFIQQYYSQHPNIPRQILTEHPIDDTELLEQWMSQQRGGAVSIKTPQRGDKRALIAMSKKNALQHQHAQHKRHTAAIVPWPKTGAAIKKALNLQQIPETIEAYDISNIQGNFAVGSMVVFQKGRPQPKNYKRFKIKALPEGQANDFAMLQEVLHRRLRHADKNHNQYWPLPDLFLIDGGTPQLRAVMKVFKQYNITKDIVAIAKKRPKKGKEYEEFHQQDKPPHRFDTRSDELKLLTALRDESHRFAIQYYRSRHNKATTQSVLDTIPGIGPKTKKILIDHFGSASEVAKANKRQLVHLVGNTKADLIQRHLNKEDTA